MTAAPVPIAQPTGFDYAQLDDAAADEARAAVERYRGRRDVLIFDTGRDLLRVKDRVVPGLFTAWVESELSISIRLAQHMMNVATRLGAESEKFSLLPDSALYKMSAPSTPQAAVDQISKRIEAGERLKLDEVERVIATEKDSVRAQAAAVKEAARRAKLTPEERKAEDAQNKRRSTIAQKKAAAHEATREEYASLNAKKTARAAEAAQILIDTLGADGATDFAMRYGDVFWEMRRLLAGEVDR